MFDPSGRYIYFGHAGFFGHHSPLVRPAPHDWNVSMVSLDGKEARQISEGEFYELQGPSISPDGRALAVSLSVDPEEMRIYDLSDLKKAPIVLKPQIPGSPEGGPFFGDVWFMPDGKTLLFSAAIDQPDGEFGYDAFLLDISTGKLERLTVGNGYATDFRPSADGRSVLFFRWHKDWRSWPVWNALCRLDIASKSVKTVKLELPHTSK